MTLPVTTDNLPPHPVEGLIDKDGQLHTQWHNWLITLRDHTLGKNNVSSNQIISSGDSISLPSKLIRLKSDGLNITPGNPQIKAGFDGQTIRLQGLDTTDTITLVDGSGLSLESGVNFTLALNSIIDFHYDSQQKLWIESNRRD